MTFVPVQIFPPSSPYFEGGIATWYPDVSPTTGDIVFPGGTGNATISTTGTTGAVVTDLYTASAPASFIFPASPSYSQDGTKIVFSEKDSTTSPTTYNIYTMNADGSNLVKVWTDNSGVFFGNSLYPRFNPAGAKIIYQIRDATAAYTIFRTMNADGTGDASFLDLSGATTSVREADWAVDNLIIFVKDDGTAVFATCDNTGSGIADITLDWGGPALSELSNPRRFWGGTRFWFICIDGALNYLMVAEIDGTGTTAVVAESAFETIPQPHFGIGIFSSLNNFVISVSEFTLADVDATIPRLPICRILYGLGA